MGGTCGVRRNGLKERKGRQKGQEFPVTSDLFTGGTALLQEDRSFQKAPGDLEARQEKNEGKKGLCPSIEGSECYFHYKGVFPI